MRIGDKTTFLVAATTLVIGLVSAVSASAQDGKKHENFVQRTNKKVTHALDKAGHAVEYSTRKDGEQASIAAHKATGKNSVVRNRAKKKNYVVHPGGTKSPESHKSTAKR